MNSRADLILKAQVGDAQALSALLAFCQTDIKRYAAIHCRANDLEDVTQETLLAVSESITSLKEVRSFSLWLFTIVKRECQRALRLSYRLLEIKRGQEVSPVLTSSNAELKSDLIKCFQSLPPHYLVVILLRDFEELSVKEIATQLGEDVPAIKSRIHRAREMIREYLLETPRL